MKDKPADKKLTYARPELRKDMTAEEEEASINEMSEAIVDAIFGKEFGKGAKKKGKDKAREGKQ